MIYIDSIAGEHISFPHITFGSCVCIGHMASNPSIALTNYSISNGLHYSVCVQGRSCLIYHQLAWDFQPIMRTSDIDSGFMKKS